MSVAALDRPADTETSTPGKKRPGFEPAPGHVVQAHVFVLDPNAGAEQALSQHCGAARKAFNWALGRVKANLAQREAERSYGVPDQELTPSLNWSAYGMRRAWNQAKDTVAPWWGQCSEEAYNAGLANAATTLKNWNGSRQGHRTGRKVGFARFKSKRTATPSCRFTTGTIRVEEDRRHVSLPRLGTIRTHENTGKLQRRLAHGTARILSATVSHRRGRWQVAFQGEVEKSARNAARPDAVVGLDLGIKTLAVTADSDGGVGRIANPRHLDATQKSIRRANRRRSRRRGPAVPDPATGTTTRRAPSSRWRKAGKKLAELHHRVANLRQDALHELTTGLVREYGTVVVEDLNVSGMGKNRRLSRRVADASFGQIRRQLTYKTRWAVGKLLVADRWFPSSKTCSRCRAVKSKLPLHVRVFACGECGLVIDRDLNAALNLAALAAAGSTGTGVAGGPEPQDSKARGADRRTPNRAGPGARPGGTGGAEPRKRKEVRHRTQDTQLPLW